MAIREFIIDPDTRAIVRQPDAMGSKTSLMQYDHFSEIFTFAIPLEIEGQDMSECDVLEMYFQNVNKATSVSTRRESVGMKVIYNKNDADKKDGITIDSKNAMIHFSWTVPQEATLYVGKLNFQIRFIKYDDEGAISYLWHSAVNSDISIVGGIPMTEEEMLPSTTATLQALELIEHDTGLDVILDGRVHSIKHGYSGVYIGDDEADWPPNANVWIDPNGDASIDDTGLSQAIDENSTDIEIPSAKAVYNYVDSVFAEVNTLLEQVVNGEEA